MSRALLALAALALSAPAVAGGTLTIEKKGLFPTFAWVDGLARGKVKGKSPLVMPVDAGSHEVWLAMEPQGTVTLCHGLVDVAEGGAAAVSSKMTGCDGLAPGYGAPERSAFKGAEVMFTVDAAVDAWVKIDGGQLLALPSMPFLLNLAPGSHTLVLYRDVQETSVFSQGMVSLGAGQRLPVTCTVGGCMGFDQPPTVIIELHQAPGVRVDVRVGG